MARVAHTHGGTDEGAAFHYAKPVSAPGGVEIRSVGGAISATPADDGVLRIDATKEVEEGGDASEVRVVAVEHDGGVVVCALFREDADDDCTPGDDDDDHDSHHGGSHELHVQTHFTVRVPAGVRFVGRTMSGAISAEDLGGDVRALTMSGAIHARATGAVEARTMNGAIDATIAAGPGPFVFESMNGDVSVSVPASMSADVHASTMHGDVESDFPLAENSGFGPSEGSGRIGEGGISIEASTMNGDVSIHRVGDAPHPEESKETEEN
jgi:hypothetical protein